MTFLIFDKGMLRNELDLLSSPKHSKLITGLRTAVDEGRGNVRQGSNKP
ncbi:MAG: hypothetical protein WB053_05270 [Nitrososphaeraceae archaeon]